MTTEEFKSFLNRRITLRCALPFKLPALALEDIIEDAERYFYKNYDEALEDRYLVIPLEHFKSVEFNRNRTVKLPKCVQFIGRVFVSGHNMTNSLVENVSWSSPEDLLYIVSWESFRSIANMFSLDTITAKYNENSRNLFIVGREPFASAIVEVMVKQKSEDLNEDELFQRYCLGKAFKQLGLVLGVFDYENPGGVTIDADKYDTIGQEILDEVKEYFEEQMPMWFFDNL